MSAPSVYQKLKQGVVGGSDRVSAVVLEYDRRFSAYGQDFIFYDYNEPLSLPPSVAPHSFDIVLADPPYLSEECLSKVAQTVRFLSKGKVLLCTGGSEEPTDLIDCCIYSKRGLVSVFWFCRSRHGESGQRTAGCKNVQLFAQTQQKLVQPVPLFCQLSFPSAVLLRS